MIKLFLIAILAGVVWLAMTDNPLKHSAVEIESASDLVVSTTPGVSKTVDSPHGKFSYDLIRVGVAEVPQLIANYEDKFSSFELVKKYGCKKGVNGGFYSEDFRPIGGVRSNGADRQKYTKNNLFNGYVGATGAGELLIGFNWRPDLTDEVQTGPVLIAKGQAQRLSLGRDKQARRMLAATGPLGGYFLTVFGPEALLDGPQLENLPEVALEVFKLEEIEVEWAVNLDGGAASAWYSESLTLAEWQPVGSFWCLK